MYKGLHKNTVYIKLVSVKDWYTHSLDTCVLRWSQLNVLCQQTSHLHDPFPNLEHLSYGFYVYQIRTVSMCTNRWTQCPRQGFTLTQDRNTTQPPSRCRPQTLSYLILSDHHDHPADGGTVSYWSRVDSWILHIPTLPMLTILPLTVTSSVLTESEWESDRVTENP